MTILPYLIRSHALWMRAGYRCIALLKITAQRAAQSQLQHSAPLRQCIPAMKGKQGALPSARTLRARHHNENTGGPVTTIKKEEETDGPSPLTTSGKQRTKRELKAETPLKPSKRQKVKMEDQVAAQMVRLAPVAPTAYTGPFPKLMRPSPEECRASFLLQSCPLHTAILPCMSSSSTTLRKLLLQICPIM